MVEFKVRVNLSLKGLTSLKGIEFPEGIKIVYCSYNQLTSLEGLPEGVKYVYCDHNKLTSLKGLPEGVKYVDCDNNQLTSLEGLPQGIKEVHCCYNQLTSLEGLPQGVKIVYCADNQLTSLEGLPEGVKTVQLTDLGEIDTRHIFNESLLENLFQYYKDRVVQQVFSIAFCRQREGSPLNCLPKDVITYMLPFIDRHNYLRQGQQKRKREG
jgi:hypothetical protein